MRCENKNHILDLYYTEGNELERKDTLNHIAECAVCRDYLSSLKSSMAVLDKLEEQKPSPDLFNKVLVEVSSSIPKPVKQYSGVPVIPILQIAFGQIFLFSLIYILNMEIAGSALWKAIKDFWLLEIIGSVGLALIIVLFAGAFITLSIAPILLFESKEKNYC